MVKAVVFYTLSAQLWKRKYLKKYVDKTFALQISLLFFIDVEIIKYLKYLNISNVEGKMRGGCLL